MVTLSELEPGEQARYRQEMVGLLKQIREQLISLQRQQLSWLVLGNAGGIAIVIGYVNSAGWSWPPAISLWAFFLGLCCGVFPFELLVRRTSEGFDRTLGLVELEHSGTLNIEVRQAIGWRPMYDTINVRMADSSLVLFVIGGLSGLIPATTSLLFSP